MKYILSICLLLEIIPSCSSHSENKLDRPKFLTRQFPIPADTTIQSIAYLNGYLLLLQENGKSLVLDTAYKRNKNLERKLDSINPMYMFRYNDTLFASNENKDYYLSDDFSAIEYKHQKRRYGSVLFEDSVYLVYGCCAGEWGGAVFFLNKRTGKTYSYFATCPDQTLRFGNEYIVCNNLAHLSDHMSFLIVKDPTTLYEIKEEKLKNHCNWYTTIDSLKDYWQVSKVGAVKFYQAYDVMSLITFPFRDSLYSILSMPKATILAVHRGDTTMTMDTLLTRKIFFHETQIIDAGKSKVSLFRLTQGSPFAAYWATGNNTGLIVVTGNRIDFLGSQIFK